MTYKYKCSADHITEIEQRISADPLTECPKPDCSESAHRVPNNEGGFAIRGFSEKNSYS